MEKKESVENSTLGFRYTILEFWKKLQNCYWKKLWKLWNLLSMFEKIQFIVSLFPQFSDWDLLGLVYNKESQLEVKF